MNKPIFLSPNLFINDINKFDGSFQEIRNLFVAENFVIVNPFLCIILRGNDLEPKSRNIKVVKWSDVAKRLLMQIKKN